jgi:hypothetical protein
MKRAIHFLTGACVIAAFTQGTVHGQVNRFNGRFLPVAQMQMYQQALAMNQMQAMSGMGTWNQRTNNAALMNQLGAQTFGTNYGIPFDYAQVANYYSPPFFGGGYSGGFNQGFYPPVATPYVNPYAPAGAGYGIGANPYAPGGGDPYGGYGGGYGYNPYNPYNNPYNSPGGTLLGAANVMQSYGSVINAQEQARILREQALQAKLETKKKAFDLDMYIKANTPTYTQEQEVNVRNTLRRIQTNSLAGEVQNGHSLNFLLKDLAKYPAKKIALEPLALSEGVLTHLNVTKNTFGIGLLRDNGRVNWPSALPMTAAQRKELDGQLKTLVEQAYGKNGRPDPNLLKDVKNEIDRVRDDLLKKVNEIPSTQYMDAKRFLQEFDQATTALDRGEAQVQAKFQRFIEGGRSVQDVADYMIKEGLRFAPATVDDEPAYRAVHSAMATYDLAMNAAVGLDGKD